MPGCRFRRWNKDEPVRLSARMILEERVAADIVVLRTFDNEVSARFAATVLEANGIPAQIAADTAGGALPSMALLFPVRLLVRAEDETIARDLLDSEVASADELGDADEPEDAEG